MAEINLQALDAVDIFKVAMMRSGKLAPQIAEEMGWSMAQINRIASVAKYYPSFPELPKFCSVVKNTLVVEWLQQRAVTYGIEIEHADVNCQSLVKEVSSLFSETSDVGQQVAAAIADDKLEKRELRAIIRELADVVNASMNFLEQLRAHEQSMK